MLQVKNNKLAKLIIKGAAVVSLLLGCTTQALALPSFARQTGESCDSCHVGAYGPQLTPHGMKFKLGGYTDSDGKKGHIPLAAMLIDNYSHTSKDQDHSDVGFDPNNNNVIQEESVFLAGKLGDHIGSFMQVTHSGVDKVTTLDNTEFRYAREATLFGHSGVYGVTINNNPTMQDPYNTLPTWKFPFNSADLADAPGAAPLLDDGIAGQVFGVNAYGQLDNGVYAELGFYRSLTESILDRLNVGAETELSKSAPYIRVAYFKDMHKSNYSFGVVNMTANVQPYNSPGPNVKVTDFGVDGRYQYLGNRKKIISVNGSYITEKQDDPGQSVNLNQLNLSGSIYLDKSYGGTVRYFSTTGDVKASNGWTLQADWTPFGKEESWKAPYANIRLGLQYTLYGKYEDDSSNASDFNTMMAFVWLSI